jgi:membrane protease YdiL (CAAX protease family)
MTPSSPPNHRGLILAGVLAAIAITTTMDATGLTMFSALPLFPLAGLFWYLGKYSRTETGLTLGTREGYAWALGYAVVVPGLIAALAFTFGAVDLTGANWGKTIRDFALGASVGSLMVLLTEEGFFRGWLWAAFGKTQTSARCILIRSSLIFSLWHLSAVLLDTGFAPPAAQIPVFLVNATLLGLNWGLMRMLSGSAVVPAVSHAFWNAVVYGLFGFGEKTGELGIVQTVIYGPEIGYLGLVANVVFALVLWRRVKPDAR